jgi:glycosyltransferase involved in cell wall biosynthesis
LEESKFPLNILLLSDHFIPIVGGGEFIVHYWAQELHARGHNVVVPILTSWKARHDNHTKFPYNVERFPYLPFMPLMSRTLQFRKLNQKRPFDIIHANFLYSAGHVGVNLQQRFGVPCIVSAQGADILVYPELHYGNLLNPKILNASQKVVRKAAGLVYNCQSVQRRLMDLGAAESQLHYVVNGSCYSQIASIAKDGLRKTLGLPEEELIFLTVSRHSPIKGVHLLIDAVAEVRQRTDKQFRVVLIGPRTEKLLPQIMQRGLERYFTVIGEIPLEVDPMTGLPCMPTRRVMQFLKAADVYISPALSGTFELSGADAMAAGLGMIVSDNIGNQDVIQNGHNGFVVPHNRADAIAGAMLTFITQPELARQMGHINERQARDYDWSQIAAKLEACYYATITRWNQRRRV